VGSLDLRVSGLDRFVEVVDSVLKVIAQLLQVGGRLEFREVDFTICIEEILR
jgi:hypothetical protein